MASCPAMTVDGVYFRLSYAAASVTALKVEPGGYRLWMARSLKGLSVRARMAFQ